MMHDTRKRTRKQNVAEGLQNKKEKYPFQIKENNGNRWYNTDGSKYRKEFRFKEDSVREVALKEKIKELEDKLKSNIEVIIHCLFCDCDCSQLVNLIGVLLLACCC